MKIRIRIFTVILCIALYVTHSTEALGCIVAAAIHELGHIFVARMLHVSFKELKLSPFGASLTPNGSMGSFGTEIIICLAGPLANIISAIIVNLYFNKSDFTTLFIVSSLFLAFLNLLPISEFDGGRILYAIIESKSSQKTADVVLSAISFILVFILWTLSLYFLIRLASSLTLFIFSCNLFAKLFLKNA